MQHYWVISGLLIVICVSGMSLAFEKLVKKKIQCSKFLTYKVLIKTFHVHHLLKIWFACTNLMCVPPVSLTFSLEIED